MTSTPPSAPLEEADKSDDSSPVILMPQECGKEINVHSRPCPRRPGIMDLPDELLLKIWDHFPSNIQHIKNLRLMCRRFYATISHLLIPVLRVDTSTRSLSRFEEISRHPLISKGVKAVEVPLFLYHSWLTLSEFADHHAMELQNVINRAEDRGPSTLNNPEPISNEAMEKGRAILESWREGNALYDERNILYKGHEEYERRVVDLNRTFIRTVAAAIARMPNAKGMHLYDDYHNRDDSSNGDKLKPFHLTQDNEALHDALFASMLVSRRMPRGSRAGFVKLLVELLVAINKAGVLLTELKINIDVYFSEELSHMALSEENFHDLKAATRMLRNFEFNSYGGYGYFLSRDELKHFKRFVGTLVSSESFENVMLDLDFLRNGQAFIPIYLIIKAVGVN